MISSYVTYEEIETALTAIHEAILTNDFKSSDIVRPSMQDTLKKLRQIDNSIKTKNELKADAFIVAEHNPSRLAMFLLAHYSEYALNGAALTIFRDNPEKWPSMHINSYRLKLHEEESHEVLFEGNAEYEPDKYDIDTDFLSQVTVYLNTGKEENTTPHSYDSFAHYNAKTKLYTKCGYGRPFRKIEVKGAYWTSGDSTHGADYVVKFDRDRIKLLAVKSNLSEKTHTLSLTQSGQGYCYKYYDLLSKFSDFVGVSWEDFIIDEEKTNE